MSKIQKISGMPDVAQLVRAADRSTKRSLDARYDARLQASKLPPPPCHERLCRYRPIILQASVEAVRRHGYCRSPTLPDVFRLLRELLFNSVRSD